MDSNKFWLFFRYRERGKCLKLDYNRSRERFTAVVMFQNREAFQRQLKQNPMTLYLLNTYQLLYSNFFYCLFSLGLVTCNCNVILLNLRRVIHKLWRGGLDSKKNRIPISRVKLIIIIITRLSWITLCSEYKLVSELIYVNLACHCARHHKFAPKNCDIYKWKEFHHRSSEEE